MNLKLENPKKNKNEKTPKNEKNEKNKNDFFKKQNSHSDSTFKKNRSYKLTSKTSLESHGKDVSLYFQKIDWFGPFWMKVIMRKFDLKFSEVGDSLMTDLFVYINSKIDHEIKTQNYLDISYCRVSEIIFFELENLPFLKNFLTQKIHFLNFEANQMVWSEQLIDFLDSLCLSSSQSLKYMNLSDISPDFSILKNSENEDLLPSNFTIFEVILFKLTSLRTLILRNCQIKEFWKLKFDQKKINKNLRKIDIRDNCFEFDSMAVFLANRAFSPELKNLKIGKQNSSIWKLSYSAEMLIEEGS